MRTLLLFFAMIAIVPGAYAVTVTQLVLPAYVGTYNAVPFSSSVDQLRCTTVSAPYSITNADHLTFGVTTAGGTCAVGLYSEDGSTFLLGSSLSCTSTGAKVTSASPAVNIVAGARYRLCTCSSSTATRTIGLGDFSGIGEVSEMLNADGTTRVGIGTACTAGALPPTTGGLTPSHFLFPVVVIE